jgi:hypothetical protein
MVVVVHRITNKGLKSYVSGRVETERGEYAVRILFMLYFLRSILLFSNTDVFITKIYMNTFILTKSIMDLRE